MMNENKAFLGQKAASIIDANMRFVAPASLFVFSDGEELIEELYGYDLQNGEMVVPHYAPTICEFVGGDGYIYPAWNETEWVESATAEEISVWEKEHPAHYIEPTRLDKLEAQVAYMAMMSDMPMEV